MTAVFRQTETLDSLPARQLKALIIDDDDGQIQRMLRRIFGQCRYAVDIAETCREALDRAAGNAYDLALVDVNLSDGSGFDLIEPIRKFSPHIEIVSMTGDNPLLLEVEARKHQVACHLSKPFDFQELISVLTHLTRSAQALSF